MRLSNAITIRCQRLGQTDKALHVKVGFDRRIWLARHQIKVWSVVGETLLIAVPGWLAKKHDLQETPILPKDPSGPDNLGRRFEREPLVRYLPDPQPVGKLPERRALPKPPRRGKLPEL